MPRFSASRTLTLILLASALNLAQPALCRCAEFQGQVVDADTGKDIPARVYLRSKADGKWLFVESASPDGSALPYREQWVPMPNSVERHTTISAHPFHASLDPGTYEIEIVRGKEYLPLREEFTIGSQSVSKTFALRRWVNMAARGWYSGETHVHRRIHELPNVQLAEDLNVAFPVTFWTIRAGEAPGLSPSPLRRQGPSPFGPRVDKGNAMIAIDDTHVIFPRNTEYEIFSIGEKRHVLGAVFLLNHKRVFQQGAPPIGDIAAAARKEGALLDLDKHSWPWSMMLIPIAKVNLYELSNNSLWRTNFGFRRASTPPADYMKVERDGMNLTELGWIQYGFENYYALLNCGFDIQPTAGTASGVHPVPLGFGRVYAKPSGERFDGANWIEALRSGHSFVTTEPMLFGELDGRAQGTQVEWEQPGEAVLTGEAIGPRPLTSVEILVNGRVVKHLKPQNERTAKGAFRTRWNERLQIERTSWVAIRAFRFADDRVRFAHTAPWKIRVAGQAMRPRRQEIEFLMSRVENEIQRSRSVLAPEALAEFERALEIYRTHAKRSVPNETP